MTLAIDCVVPRMARATRRTGSSAFADDDSRGCATDSIFKQQRPQLRDLAAPAREF
jgi:hypothetical protein